MPGFDDWLLVIVHPGIKVSTAEARAADWLTQHYLQNDEGFVYICRLDTSFQYPYNDGLNDDTLQYQGAQRAGQFRPSDQAGPWSSAGAVFPMALPAFALTEIDELLEMNFVNFSARILSTYIGDALPLERVLARMTAAFAFPRHRWCGSPRI